MLLKFVADLTGELLDVGQKVVKTAYNIIK
jgi:hypothetical protein